MKTIIYKTIAIIVGVMVVMPVACRAAEKRTTAEAYWAEGISAYEEGDYGRAVELFEHIVNLDEVSADLYYNLAGAYFKLGQQHTLDSARPFSGGELGHAIVNYHRALRLNPAMEDAHYNLDLARDYTNDTKAVPMSLLATLWLAVRNMTTSNVWAIISIIALALTLSLTLFYLLSERVAVRKVGFFLALALLLIFIITTALAISSRRAIEVDNRAVVVCNDTMPVHASPDSSSKIIRRPSQGVTVDVLRNHGEWTEIHFVDGEKGWIRSANIEKI